MWVGDLFNVTVQHSNVWARSTENNWKKDVNESGISNSLQRSVFENQNNVVNESVKEVNESGISNSLHRSVYENQNKVVNESGILKNIKYFE